MPRRVLLGLAFAGCVAHEPVRPAPTARTVAFRCAGDVAFTARFDPGTVLVDLGARAVRLREVEVEVGRRFRGEGVTLWRKGDLAVISLPGAEVACARDRAG